MKRNLFCIGSFFASSLASVSALAFDFSAADAAFALRENFDKLKESRSLYEAALTSGATADEKIYAVEQASRLDYLEGLNNSNAADQIVIFNKCGERVEAIKPANNNSVPAYYYWKGSCLASWARANGVLVSLNRSKELVELFNIGKSIDATYEGGGFDRVLSAIYFKLPAINPFGPGGDKKKAFEFSDAALASAAYSGAVDPATSTGDYYYNVYEFRAEILEGLGKKADAVSLLKTAIARIEAGDVATDRAPENQAHKAVLVALLAKFQQ